LHVLPHNDPPTISPIPAASTTVGQPTAQLPFAIGDAENLPDQLTLTARSSNTNLAPVPNIEFSGSGSNRTVRVTPAVGQTGLAIVTIEVTDFDGAVAEAIFELVVNGTNGPPVIALQPFGQLVNLGDPATLRVIATGPGPLHFQWQKDGSTLSGQTNATLAFAAVQRSDQGAYRVVVTNVNGSATSLAADLDVFEAARIISVSQGGGFAQIIAESSLGQRYTLEFCDNLATAVWTPLQTIDGTGSPITFTDPAASPAFRFYRLSIQQAP
jgi:hypothetical protein